MSLSIDSYKVCALYAFDRWFQCVVGSVYTDAYEFRDDLEPGGRFDAMGTVFRMGDAYPPLPKEEFGSLGPNSQRKYASPSPHTGISFTDPDSGDRISFPLFEVKAFKEKQDLDPEVTR